jgi:hypothetical protein
MWTFLKKYKNGIFNVVAVAGTVVAGILSGGVFTLPVIITAVSTVAGKLAASPVDHAGTAEQAHVERVQEKKAGQP